jgi:hypothetical protein
LTAAVVAIALVPVSAAHSCTVPPPPFDPRYQKADVVLLGEIGNVVSPGRDAQLKVNRVVAGTFSAPSYAISHFAFDGSGLCPLGPELHKGDRVVAYLGKAAGNKLELRGFLYLMDATKVDQRLAKH